MYAGKPVCMNLRKWVCPKNNMTLCPICFLLIYMYIHLYILTYVREYVRIRYQHDEARQKDGPHHVRNPTQFKRESTQL